MNGYRASALGLLLLAIGIVPARANLVMDPGFEGCTSFGQTPILGWSGTATCDNTIGVAPHSGNWAALVGSGFPIGESTQTLSQPLNAPAGEYQFSFWLNNTSSNTDNSFTASFGGQQVLDITDAFGHAGYIFYEFIVSTGQNPTINYDGTQTEGQFFVDDVSVTPTPEPPSLALLAAGLLGLGAVYRRR
jgi:MYXO-CTERM domain-containing protein